MTVAFLFVTCCLEPSRANILAKVVANLQEQAPELSKSLIVFDNASTHEGVKDLLTSNFSNVYQADHNVGYWSAIDWWLNQLSLQEKKPEFTYIIESDMIHYAFNNLWPCATYMSNHPEIGAIRLHEYSVENCHLYNKDKQVPGGRPAAWQSHTNKVTGKAVRLIQATDPGFQSIWHANFLTQLPALNRFSTMLGVFNQLNKMPQFSELDFQALYHNQHQMNAVLDGGIFNSDLGGDTKNNAAIGSWTPPEVLKKMGYQTTRYASIAPRDQYTVIKL
jgi:hypothetical protein